MRKAFSLMCLLALSIASLWAQVSSSNLITADGTIRSTGSSTLAATGGTWVTSWSDGTLHATYAIASVSNCVNAQGYLVACGGGPPYETRKDDGKGPSLLQVKSSAHPLATRELPPLEYVALAKSVGASSAVVEQAQMLELIDKLGLHVYDWNRVDNYLYRQALHQGTNVRWVWKPMRSADVEAVAYNSLMLREGVGMTYAKAYARPLPVRVLKRIKEIECEMPDAMFLISDYEVVKPDPFLAITTKNLLEAGKIWIVDQWEEPGFTEAEVQARR